VRFFPTSETIAAAEQVGSVLQGRLSFLNSFLLGSEQASARAGKVADLADELAAVIAKQSVVVICSKSLVGHLVGHVAYQLWAFKTRASRMSLFVAGFHNSRSVNMRADHTYVTGIKALAIRIMARA
jgi:hypothetical protein